MAAPFDVNDFAFQKIAVMPETEEERDEFLKYMKQEWPAYMRNYSGVGYKVGTQYVIGYGVADFLRVSVVPDFLPNQGWTVITYKELCGRCVDWQEACPIDDLLN